MDEETKTMEMEINIEGYLRWLLSWLLPNTSDKMMKSVDEIITMMGESFKGLNETLTRNPAKKRRLENILLSVYEIVPCNDNVENALTDIRKLFPQLDRLIKRQEE